MKMFPSFARIGWGSKREDRLLALQHHFDRQRKVTKARRDPPRAGHAKPYEQWQYGPPLAPITLPALLFPCLVANQGSYAEERQQPG